MDRTAALRYARSRTVPLKQKNTASADTGVTYNRALFLRLLGPHPSPDSYCFSARVSSKGRITLGILCGAETYCIRCTIPDLTGGFFKAGEVLHFEATREKNRIVIECYRDAARPKAEYLAGAAIALNLEGLPGGRQCSLDRKFVRNVSASPDTTGDTPPATED